jgi:uncharacterized protein YceK
MNRISLVLLVAALAVSGCSTVSAVNNGFKMASLATRVVSSTGDVVFDHNGNGK